MDILHFEDYFYEVWENVPYDVVDDSVWNYNQELIRELTFSFYNIYKNTVHLDTDSYTLKSEMDTKRASNILKEVFSIITKFGFKFNINE